MPHYEPAPFFLLRTPALPVEAFHELMAEPDRVLSLARDPYIRRALLVASPDLVAAVDRIETAAPAKRERIRERLLRYLIRMSTRPTPFGAFSGVAIGRFGERSTAALGSPAVARTRARADMGWLLGLIKRIERDEALLPRLNVVVNATLHRAGDRMVLPYADVYGERDNRAVRIRATPAVDVVLRAAATPVPYTTVVGELAAAFPDVPAETVTGLVRELWDLNVLTSDLRPPLTEARPEQHLLKRLVGIPEAVSVAGPLEEIADLARVADDEAGLVRLGAAQRALLPDHERHTYQVDAAADLREPYLSQEVGRAVAGALDCLMRLAQAGPGQLRHLAEYREAFLERYGHDARVPLLELLGSDRGLEAPPGYTEPPRTYGLRTAAPPEERRYDRVLGELAAHAWWTGAQEVELTDEWLERLAGSDAETGTGAGGARPPLPVVDVYAQIHAADLEAIDRGEWRAVLAATGLAHGGRTYGRFFDLLDDDAVELLRDYARAEEALFPDVAYADLAYLPARGRHGNVAVRPLLRRYEVPVNTTPAVGPDRVIELDDILVGATDERMFLWSRRLGQEIVVTQHHMLAPSLAPNVSRFLLEVSHDGYTLPMGFRWGFLEGTPFLPRVTRGKVVLRPAQWTLRELADGWRERWRVPRHVFLADDDNRLLLDLDQPLAGDVLRREIKAKGEIVLEEMLPGFDGLWLRDGQGRPHAAEIVVPLIATEAPKRRVTSRPEVPAVCHPPGSGWTFLKVYAAPERHDEIIAGPLRELIAELRAAGLIDRWFYMRYADPRPHLRLRCRGPAAALLPALADWGNDLVARGPANDLQFATYEPEIARYGGPGAFDVAERFFEANSDVTAELIARRPDLRPEHLAVAAVDVLCDQWGLPPLRRIDLVPAHTAGEESHRAFREHRAYLCELLVPNVRRPHERGRADHELLAGVLAPQRPAARAMAAAVASGSVVPGSVVSGSAEAAAAAAGAGAGVGVGVGTGTGTGAEVGAGAVAGAGAAAVGAERGILGSLMHMQINRMMPIDLERESRSYALWHHALRAIRGRLVAEE